MLLVTVDTNLLDEAVLAELRAATGPRTEFVTVSVNERERGDQPVARLTVMPETLVWDESRWGQAVWGDPIPELLVLDETPLDSGVLGGNRMRTSWNPSLRSSRMAAFQRPAHAAR